MRMHSPTRFVGISLLLALVTSPEAGAAQSFVSAPASERAAADAAAPAPPAVGGLATTHRKRPEIAFALGILFPGAGHFYVGDTDRGNAFVAGTAGLVGAAGFLALLYSVNQVFCFDCQPSRGVEITIGALAIAGGAVWAYGAVDATQAARRANDRRARRVGAIHAAPVFEPARGGAGARVGLALSAPW